MGKNLRRTLPHKSAGEFSITSQITGGKQEPFPPIIEKPNPTVLLLDNNTSFSKGSIAKYARNIKVHCVFKLLAKV